MPYPFRVDDFPGFGDINDVSSGLTAVAYDLSAIQVMCRVVKNLQSNLSGRYKTYGFLRRLL